MPPFVPRKRRRSASPPSIPKLAPKGAPRKRAAATSPVRPQGKSSNSRGNLSDNSSSKVTNDASSDSELSDISSSEFEDVEPPELRGQDPSTANESDSEEAEWEDAFTFNASAGSTVGPEPSGILELVLGEVQRTPTLLDRGRGTKGPSKIERQIRIQTHCMHVQFLLYHNLLRNVWISDAEVQKIMVSLLPEGIKKEIVRWKQASGITIQPKSEDSPQKDKSKGREKRMTRAGTRNDRDWSHAAQRQEEGKPDLSRGDPLIRLLKILSAFWKKRFRITAPGLRKQGYKPLEKIGFELNSFNNGTHNALLHGERIRDIDEFRELARKCEGSRDVGAQFFTAMLRSIGLEARLVASLQPIGFGWSKADEALPKGKPNIQMNTSETTRLDPGGATSSEDENGVTKVKAVPNSGKGKSRKSRLPTKTTIKRKSIRAKGAAIDLRESRDEGNPSETDDESVVDLTPKTAEKTPPTTFDKDLPFPIYWTEVLSPVTNQYIPVDAIVSSTVANTAELMSAFEPRGAAAENARQVMAYVVAYSADGTAKDVTVRYLKRRVLPGKTKGIRMPVQKMPVYNSKGKIEKHEELDWFKKVMSGYARDSKLRTAVDDLEEQTDLKPANATKEAKVATETLQWYKTSAKFVLERHLRREEALIPSAKHVKTFKSGKGDKAKEDKVFLRKHVVPCKTIESWHKEGRGIKEGEQPLKFVPMRAVTLTRKREIEQAEAEGGKVQQGLYAKTQTDWIIPPPIENGVIPKNAYGNMDCFVPTMVPQGAVHIPYRRTAKICQRLNIDYAEAVTGFEFGAQRAVPVIQGVVVAEEHEENVMDVWRQEEVERQRKEDEKRQKATLALWRKFLMGLRIAERVREEYGRDLGEAARDKINPFTNKRRKIDSAKADEDVETSGFKRDEEGGFFPPAED